MKIYDFTVPELNYFREYCNFTEKIKEMSRDADSAEERELINKFMAKLQNIR